jgi:hypothetical protein
MTSIDARLRRVQRAASLRRIGVDPIAALVNERLCVAMMLTRLNVANGVVEAAAAREAFAEQLSALRLHVPADLLGVVWCRAHALERRMRSNPRYLVQLRVPEDMRATAIQLRRC